MTSIKAQLLAAIETDPDSILEQTLDDLEYLKTREQKSPSLSVEVPQKEGDVKVRSCATLAGSH